MIFNNVIKDKKIYLTKKSIYDKIIWIIMKKKAILICSECASRNYSIMVDPKLQVKRITLNKYCKQCNKHTLHTQS